MAVDSQGYAIAYKDGRWGAPRLVDTAKRLVGVSCTGKRFCVAAEYEGNLLLDVNGDWSLSATEADAPLAGVSWSSRRFCASVGVTVKASTFDGQEWGAAERIEHRSGGLTGVSCPSSQFCAAVDNNGHALTYDGSGWGGGPTLNNKDYAAAAVSCPTTAFCVTVDYLGHVTLYE